MSKLQPVYCYLIIIIVTYAVFYNTLNNEFVFDDESVIVNNQSITSLDNIPKFFTAEDGFHKVIGRYYRPVVSASYAIDYNIWGLNPYGFHLTNIIIHIISCLLLFKILSLLFWRYKYRNLFALFSTLIFAVHPIHTEAVSWISGRTDSMVTMFFFASFLFYIEYTKEMEFVKTENSLHTIHSIKSNSVIYLILSLIFYAIGLLTKEMIITMPVIILAYDYIYRKKNFEYFKKHLYVYILFGAVTVLYLVLRYYLLLDIPERVNYLYFAGKDIQTTAGTMIKTIPVYFRLLFAPFRLLYHYNGVIPDAKSIMDADVLLSILLILVMLITAVYFYKKDSITSFCILFFLISLTPVMNIVPSMNLMAERFLYMTSFSLVLFICHISLLGSSKQDFKILTFGMVLIVILLSYLTVLRNEDWKDNRTLYTTGNSVNGNVLLVNSGNILANQKKYDEAAILYKRAIEIRDNSVLAHHNLGLVYLLKGNLDSAEMKFKKGIFLDSLAPDGYFQLATVYNMQGKKSQAILMLEKLQNVSPNYRESAVILENLKKGELTGDDLISKNFEGEESRNQRINQLQSRSYQFYTEKKYKEAITDLKELVSLSTDSTAKSGFLNNIAMCYSELNNPDAEEKNFLAAISYDEKNLNALNGLASFYLKTGDIEKSKIYLKKITALNPADENIKRKLDSLNAK